MSRTVGLWVLLGITIACGWIAAAYLNPGANFGRSPMAVITAPAALLGRSRPLGMVPFVLLNGAVYGMLGAFAHTVRRRAH